MCMHTHTLFLFSNKTQKFTIILLVSRALNAPSQTLFLSSFLYWRWRNIYYPRLSWVLFYAKVLFLFFYPCYSFVLCYHWQNSSGRIFILFLSALAEWTHTHTPQSQIFQHKTLLFKRSDFHLNMEFFSGKILVLSMLYCTNVNKEKNALKKLPTLKRNVQTLL